MLYQFALTKVLRATIAEMKEQNLLAAVCSRNVVSMSVPMSWAHDVALLVRAHDALEVVPNLVATTRIVEANSRDIGVELNFGAGKTAAIGVFCGKHFREAKSRYLTGPVPTVVVNLRNGKQAELCLVEC